METEDCKSLAAFNLRPDGLHRHFYGSSYSDTFIANGIDLRFDRLLISLAIKRPLSVVIRDIYVGQYGPTLPSSTSPRHSGFTW